MPLSEDRLNKRLKCGQPGKDNGAWRFRLPRKARSWRSAHGINVGKTAVPRKRRHQRPRNHVVLTVCIDAHHIVLMEPVSTSAQIAVLIEKKE